MRQIAPGTQYGRWTVLGIAPSVNGRRRMLCACECGTRKPVILGRLTSGGSNSCGCLKRELTISRLTTHGDTDSSEYTAWQNMLARCYQRSDKAFKHYGARGIQVCERWHLYENFLKDMGRRPTLNHSLDRYPNNNGNYEPLNCRWAIQKDQCRNKRTNKIITAFGKSMCISAWAEEFGISPQLLRSRIIACNWTAEKALTTPVTTRRDA